MKSNGEAVKIGQVDGKDMYARLQICKQMKPITIEIVRGAMDNLDKTKRALWRRC